MTSLLRIAQCALCACGILTGSASLLLGADTAAKNQQPSQQQQQKQENGDDPRIEKIRQFFLAQRSPLAKHAESFLNAADKHGLDWRLLPSLAFVESAGGVAYRNNNVFGWGNGRIRFTSISEGIHVIAERLTNALPYRNKSVEGKLKAYNPVNKTYADHVLGIMDSMGPVASAAAAAGSSKSDSSAAANAFVGPTK